MHKSPSHEKALTVLILSGALLLISLSGVVLYFAHEAAPMVKKVDQIFTHADSLVLDAHADMNATFDNAHAVMEQAGLAADHVRQTAAEVSKQLPGVVTRIKATLDGVDGGIAEARQAIATVNGQTLPAVNATLISARTAANTAVVTLNSTSESVNKITVHADAVFNSAVKVISDPAVRDTERNLQVVTHDAEVDMDPHGPGFWRSLWKLIARKMSGGR